MNAIINLKSCIHKEVVGGGDAGDVGLPGDGGGVVLDGVRGCGGCGGCGCGCGD